MPPKKQLKYGRYEKTVMFIDYSYTIFIIYKDEPIDDQETDSNQQSIEIRKYFVNCYQQ